MAKKKVVDIVEELVQQFMDENRLELVDIEFLKEGKDWFLRIYIDKENGISLDDCQLVSEYISGKLDELDPIEQSYYLEVSSAGLDRPMKSTKDYERNVGKVIEVSVYQAIHDKKIIEGELLEINEEIIKIQCIDNSVIAIEKNNIAKAKPVISI